MVHLPTVFVLDGHEDAVFVMAITSMHRLVVPIEVMMIGLMLDGSNATQEVIYIVLNNKTRDTQEEEITILCVKNSTLSFHKNLIFVNIHIPYGGIRY